MFSDLPTLRFASTSFSLIKSGKVLAVEPKAFRVLLLLLHNPQKLISKEELLNAVWGDTAVTEGSLTRCIWLLRRQLGDDSNEPRFIETVATVGYRLMCKVEVSEIASEDLQATDKAIGLSEADFVETPANGEIAEAKANPLAQIDKLVFSFQPTHRRGSTHKGQAKTSVFRAGNHRCGCGYGCNGCDLEDSSPNSEPTKSRAFHAADKRRSR